MYYSVQLTYLYHSVPIFFWLWHFHDTIFDLSFGSPWQWNSGKLIVSTPPLFVSPPLHPIPTFSMDTSARLSTLCSHKPTVTSTFLSWICTRSIVHTIKYITISIYCTVCIYIYIHVQLLMAGSFSMILIANPVFSISCKLSFRCGSGANVWANWFSSALRSGILKPTSHSLGKAFNFPLSGT